MAFIAASAKSTPTIDYKKFNVLLYGSPGSGKTSFAAGLDIGGSAYIFDTEGGTKCLSVFSSQIRTYEDFKEGVDWAVKEKKHQHIVIDVIDDLYKMCETYVCKINKVPTISTLPFGSGYSAINNLIFGEIQRMNDAGIGVTFTSHEGIKEMTSDSHKWTAVSTSLGDKFETKLTGKCDLVLYLYKDKDNKRMIRTAGTKFHKCAKDRTSKLPETMPLDPKLLIAALNK